MLGTSSSVYEVASVCMTDVPPCWPPVRQSGVDIIKNLVPPSRAEVINTTQRAPTDRQQKTCLG